MAANLTITLDSKNIKIDSRLLPSSTTRQVRLGDGSAAKGITLSEEWKSLRSSLLIDLAMLPESGIVFARDDKTLTIKKDGSIHGDLSLLDIQLGAIGVGGIGGIKILHQKQYIDFRKLSLKKRGMFDETIDKLITSDLSDLHSTEDSALFFSKLPEDLSRIYELYSEDLQTLYSWCKDDKSDEIVKNVNKLLALPRSHKTSFQDLRDVYTMTGGAQFLKGPIDKETGSKIKKITREIRRVRSYKGPKTITDEGPQALCNGLEVDELDSLFSLGHPTIRGIINDGLIDEGISKEVFRQILREGNSAEILQALKKVFVEYHDSGTLFSEIIELCTEIPSLYQEFVTIEKFFAESKGYLPELGIEDLKEMAKFCNEKGVTLKELYNVLASCGHDKFEDIKQWSADDIKAASTVASRSFGYATPHSRKGDIHILGKILADARAQAWQNVCGAREVWGTKLLELVQEEHPCDVSSLCKSGDGMRQFSKCFKGEDVDQRWKVFQKMKKCCQDKKISFEVLHSLLVCGNSDTFDKISKWSGPAIEKASEIITAYPYTLDDSKKKFADLQKTHELLGDKKFSELTGVAHKDRPIIAKAICQDHDIRARWIASGHKEGYAFVTPLCLLEEMKEGARAGSRMQDFAKTAHDDLSALKSGDSKPHKVKRTIKFVLHFLLSGIVESHKHSATIEKNTDKLTKKLLASGSDAKIDAGLKDILRDTMQEIIELNRSKRQEGFVR